MADADVPMLLRIWLRGVSEPVVLQTNLTTVGETAALLSDPSTTMISISHDAGEKPFAFSAPRRNVAAIQAEPDPRRDGWRVLPPETVAALVQVLRLSRFESEGAMTIAQELARQLEDG